MFICAVVFPIEAKASVREGNGPLCLMGSALGKSPGNGQTAVSFARIGI